MPVNLHEFAELVRTMRRLQIAWFTVKDRDAMQESKKVERRIDRMLDKIPAWEAPPPPPTLFDEAATVVLPPPAGGSGPSCWDLVIAVAAADPELAPLVPHMRARDEFGRRKYGTPLQAGDGRDPLVDALQEALDLVVYLHKSTLAAPSLTMDLARKYALNIANLVRLEMAGYPAPESSPRDVADDAITFEGR